MKNVYLGVFLLAIISLSSMGCASQKQGQWLARHAQLLEQAANTNMSEEKKLDILAQSYVDMMHQSLNFVNPKKGVAFAQAYSKQNATNIEKIMKDLGDWKMDMDGLEAVVFAAKMITKPYAKDLIDLFPRFRRKYEMYSTIYNLSGKVKDGIIGIAGKKLGL